MTDDALTITNMTTRREAILDALDHAAMNARQGAELIDELSEIDTWLAAQDLALGDYMDGAAFDRAEAMVKSGRA